MNITVAKQWNELNPWQLREIVDLYLHQFEKDPQKTFEKMLFILFQRKRGFFARLRLWKIIKLVPISELYVFGEFLMQPPKLHKFPEIKNLKKPADRLGDLSINHYSCMDRFFHDWMESKNDLHLRRLCASIYRLGDRFDEQNLNQISKITDKLSRKERQVIGFTYMSSYHHIADTYPIVYPKPKKTDPEAVKKQPKRPHTPFSEIIINMVMNQEAQPLGNLHTTNDTRIYDFMNVFSKIILKNQKIAQENAKRK